jgi:hypothetical protein
MMANGRPTSVKPAAKTAPVMAAMSAWARK